MSTNKTTVNDNQTKLEIAARNARIEKELAAALSNRNDNRKPAGEQAKKKRKTSKGTTGTKKANTGTASSKNKTDLCYQAVSPAVSFSNTSDEKSHKGRGPKKPLDFSTLSEVTFVNEVPVYLSGPFVATCSICGSTKNVGYFKSANICLKCLNKIKRTM